MSVPPPAAVSPAQQLTGKDLDGGWTVKDRIARGPDATGGMFSTIYLVGRGDQVAFLKALDYEKVGHLFGGLNADVLRAATTAFTHERELVQHCADKRMKNVVRALDSGTVHIPGYALPDVEYIIFERADGDSRSQLDALKTFDCAWVCRSLHGVANGLAQLHRAKITHEDIKPSNVLLFDSTAKIADLGRSVWAGHPADHDALLCVGDLSYAPPELLFQDPILPERLRRMACDSYHLGSMLLFFFTKVGATSALAGHVATDHWYRDWAGTYEEVLPYLREGFARVTEDLAAEVEPCLTDKRTVEEVVGIFKQLCDPDPRLRGDPRHAQDSPRRFAMDRIVSVFDRLARRAEIELGRAPS